jgi:hypothetical protein
MRIASERCESNSQNSWPKPLDYSPKSWRNKSVKSFPGIRRFELYSSPKLWHEQTLK